MLPWTQPGWRAVRRGAGTSAPCPRRRWRRVPTVPRPRAGARAPPANRCAAAASFRCEKLLVHSGQFLEFVNGHTIAVRHRLLGRASGKQRKDIAKRFRSFFHAVLPFEARAEMIM